jgi:hypothetical protein
VVEESPLVQLLAAIDKLDVDAVMVLCAPDCRLSTVDGRHAEGHDDVRQLFGGFLSTLRSTSHRITAQWHQDEAWIAETLADYELQDWLRIEGRPSVFIVRTGADGISDVRVYGANERLLTDHPNRERPVRIGGRVVLPL